MSDNLSEARNVLKTHRRELMARPNVVATGVGYKTVQGKRTQTLSIVCSVLQKTSTAALSPEYVIPSTVGGIPTDVVATGRIRAFQVPSPIRAILSRTERLRPAPGGVSIGHRDITAGTLGCLVRRGGQTLILSNNHVLANSNEAQRGDPILQPGPIDGGGLPADHIANLEDFVPISFGEPPSQCGFARSVIALLNAGCELIRSQTRYRIVSIQAVDNLVDAAIARPLDDRNVSPEILEIGRIQGQARGELGLAIKKSGRTTGLTTGEILQVDVTVSVQYGEGRVAQFADQLLAGPMSQGGDSGSAVLDTNNRLVGLLFAGSDSTTIINRIEHVFSGLQLGL